MDYQTLYTKTVIELRKLAKEMQVKLPAGISKAQICEILAAAPQPTIQAVTEAGISEAPRKRGRPRKNPPAETAELTADTAEIPVSTFPSENSDNTDASVKPAEVSQPTEQASRSEPERSSDITVQQPGTGVEPGNAAGQSAQPSTAPHRQYTLHRTQANIQTGTVRRQGEMTQRTNRTYTPQQPRNGFRPSQNPPSFAPRTPRSDTEQPAAIQRPASTEAAESGQTRGEYNTSNQAVIDMLSSGGCNEGAGVLELHPEGYGFLRASNYLPGTNDVYISMAQIHRFALRNGDFVEGKTRPQREGDRYSAMMYIDRVNGMTPDQNARRPKFEYLVPVYPDERLRLEIPGESSDIALRLADMLAPIGKGQRGMIVSPPKAGKTTLLKKIANAITKNHPETHLIVLLIDERPEEVTDMKRSISGEVVYSTFDEAPENHTRVSEMVLDRAQRLVEHGKDVVILLDSITRLARAYNLVIPPTGRSLSGGLDPGALHKPKRFFGAARNIENGGSLTIIATALVDTGSRMDDIIFEEFKGTGNMELHLDRKLSDRRIFPAIDMYRSGTRREELLLTPAELDGEYQVRKMLGSSGNQEAAEQLISSMEKTATNADFFLRIKGWAKAFEKDGFTLSCKQR